MKRNVATIVLIALCCMAAMLCGPSSEAQKTPEVSLRIGGAGLASTQVDRWAKEFEKEHPGWSAVVSGGSTGRGFRALQQEVLDMVIASRPILENELMLFRSTGVALTSKPAGKAAIAIITSSRNSVDSLTLDQLRNIYSGKIANWKDVGGPDAKIRVLSRRAPESGAAVMFQEIILKGKPFTTKAVVPERWSTIITVCKRAEDLPIGLAPATRSLDGTKVIALKKDETSPALLPTYDNVQAGVYPITAQIFLYWNQKNSDPRIVPFADYCASKGSAK